MYQIFSAVFLVLSLIQLSVLETTDDVITEFENEIRTQYDEIYVKLLEYENKFNSTKEKVNQIIGDSLVKTANQLAELELNLQYIADDAFINGHAGDDCVEKFKNHMDNLILSNNESCYPSEQFINVATEFAKVRYILGDINEIVKNCTRNVSEGKPDNLRICIRDKLKHDTDYVLGFEYALDYYLDVAFSNTEGCLEIASLILNKDGLGLTLSYYECIEQLKITQT